jgi:hypothetical protein
MTVPYPYHDRFELAAATKLHCRIVYKDDHGEHHAVMAQPKEWREIDGVEWGFFTSEAGEEMEVQLNDILAIELPEA